MKYLITNYLSLFFALGLIFIVGCSSDEKKTEAKTYSEDTNRAFEMIERGGSYYLKKAPTHSVVPPQVKPLQPALKRPAIPERRRIVETLKPGAQETVQEEIVIDEKINYQNIAQETPPVPVTKARSNSKTDERLIEINQNLAFYCMKHRKDPSFGGSEAKCMKFVNKTMNNCQKIHRIVNSKLLSCIQKKLKGRN